MLYISDSRPGLAVPGSMIPSTTTSYAMVAETLSTAEQTTSSATPSSTDVSSGFELGILRLVSTDLGASAEDLSLAVLAGDVSTGVDTQTPSAATFASAEALGLEDNLQLHLSSPDTWMTNLDEGLGLTSREFLQYLDLGAAVKSYTGTGLIIKMSLLPSSPVTPVVLGQWLTQIQADHPEITTIVLEDIADINGTLYFQWLDVIMPFMPGGAGSPLFANGYIGTVSVPWVSAGSKNVEGIQNSTFRALNVSLSTTAATAFKVRYPGFTGDWFITYDADLIQFSDSAISGAYLTYINALMTALNGVTAGKKFMWNPSFSIQFPHLFAPDLWGTYVNTLQTNLVTFVTGLNSPTVVNLYDGVGSGVNEQGGSVAWSQYVTAYLGSVLNSVLLDAEQFQIIDGAQVAADATEVTDREAYYTSRGVPLGPVWDLLFWHKRNYGS